MGQILMRQPMLSYLLYFFSIATFISIPVYGKSKKTSQLDRTIVAEIKDDSFYQAIQTLASRENISTILEIGSSCGDGSTEAFVSGILKNPARPLLFCMELSQPRFKLLKKRYKDVSSVRCYNVSSVSLDSFPTEEEVSSFYKSVPTNLNHHELDTILGWLRQDIAYIKKSNAPQHGISLIKKENKIENFDMVLIDGSEFTGEAEFKLVYGAKWILLDDIIAFKNHANYHQLLQDTNYELVEENTTLRNGYAIFKKKGA